MAQYAESTLQVWKIAAHEAAASQADAIEPAHLLLGLCKICDVDLAQMLPDPNERNSPKWRDLENDAMSLRTTFLRAGLDTTAFRRRLRSRVQNQGGRRPGPNEQIHRSPGAKQAFSQAEQLSRNDTTGTCRASHLLEALLSMRGQPWDPVFQEMGVSAALFATAGGTPNTFQVFSDAPPPPVRQARVQQGPAASPAGAPARPEAAPAAGANGASATPTIDQFGRDLTQQAREGRIEKVIGRDSEVREMARALVQKRKHNAILVGAPGVGKTAVVEAMALWLLSDEAPPELQGRRIIELSMSTLVAGASLRGAFEERLQGIIDEAENAPDVILFIDEIHTVMDAGGKGASNAAQILKPALARGRVQVIGATTEKEFRQYIEKDPAFQRRFGVVWIEEPSREDTLAILRGIRTRFEEHHNLEITDASLEAAVDLSVRYMPDQQLPDKAIDLIDQACVRARISTVAFTGAAQAKHQIGRDDIAAVVSQRCRIPIEKMTQDQAQQLLKMEEALIARVKGQDEAVSAIAEAVRTARAGLKSPNKPVGSFLFVGTTGTGKTELAKALAEFLFGEQDRLVRIDMSEFMEKHSMSRLVGSPPGYVGQDEEGQLTGAVRTNPYSVVLFDEIEKAHPEILDIMLQILDEGRLTDARGRKVSFTETVVILTSNLGAQAATAAPPPQRRPLGFGVGTDDAGAANNTPADAVATTEEGREAYRQSIMGAVRKALRPEIFNRIQNLVYFYPLSAEVVREIVDKLIDRVNKRLKERDIEVSLTQPAFDELMRQGYDVSLGAREMDRTIERMLVQPLGKALLEGRFPNGCRIRVGATDGHLTMETA